MAHDPAKAGAREAGWLLLAAVLCLAPRLWFAREYPTVPYSDFNNLLNFAIALNEPGWEATKGFWQYFGIGLPYALSLVLRVVPGPPAEVARYATAVVTGLAALSPFVIWRGAFGLLTRMTSAILLGLWPGHVFFSGVVAQDNWILLPSVALGALAVRALVRREGWPLLSAALLCAAGAVRQEMLVVLVPLALPAAGIFLPGARVRRLTTWSVVTALCLLALATVRWAGSGRFSLGTEHAGLAILGAATPGAGAGYWNFPQAHFAAYAPELEEDFPAMRARAMGLALEELARRPLFHAVRMFSAGMNSVARTDATILAQAVAAEPAMPPSHRAKGAALTARVAPRIDQVPLFVLGLFVGVLVAGVAPRAPLLALAAAMVLKVVVHAAIVAQSRYFIVVTALALTGLAFAVGERVRSAPALRIAAAIVIGYLLAHGAGRAAARAERYVLAREEQLTYRFTVHGPVHPPRLRCTMSRGLLSLGAAVPTIRPLRTDPAPGDEALAECRVEAGSAPLPLVLEVLDSYEGSGWPGRIVQSVEVDGREVLRHDIGDEAWKGWKQVPLVNDRGLPAEAVTVRVQAVKPEAGWLWGYAANTSFRLAPVTPRPTPGP